MNDKDLYKQKLRAQLDESKAEIARLKARAMGAKADAQIAMNKQVQALEGKLDYAQSKFSELTQASDGAWDSVKKGAESAWESLTSAFNDTTTKVKEKAAGERDLYKQQLKAQLEESKAEIAKLKAQVAAATADARLSMSKHVDGLERKLEYVQTKLSDLSGASSDMWDSVKSGVDSAWHSFKTAMSDVGSMFKEQFTGGVK